MLKVRADHEVDERIGSLLRIVRRHLGLNQSLVAPKLGLDQSALSRVESGRQILSMPQWTKFCDIAGISLDAIDSGNFELARPETAIRLPSRYAFEKHTKARSLLPLLHFSRSTMGERGFTGFLESIKVDEEFFLNLNAEINFNFTLDLIAVLIKKTGMKGKDAELITRTAAEAHAHGSLRHFFGYLGDNPFALIAGWVDQTEKYGDNFRYEVLDRQKAHIDVTMTPLPHMKELTHTQDPLLADFLIHYDKGYLQNLSGYGGKKPLKGTVVESCYNGSARSLFRFK